MTYADYITKATPEERVEMRKRIEAIIGTKENAKAWGKDLSDKINRGMKWQKEFEKLSLIFFQHGEKALALNYTQIGGNSFKGVTANGKRWTLEGNNGWTERSRYCGTLYIEGEGTIFTSGRLDRAFDYILTH